MEPLYIDGTELTFGVELDKTSGIFRFTGKSRPENAPVFFESIFLWFDKYQFVPNNQTVIEFMVDYYNSSTAKILLRLLVLFENMVAQGIDIKVHWYYKAADEDLLEAGEDFASLVSVPFEFYQRS